MSDLILPSLPGLAWNTVRTPTWKTRIQTVVSGKETRQADWSYPRYGYEINFEFLRSGLSYGELQTLIGFINQMQGQFGTFLYTDDDDNAVTGQQIGTGDGTTTTFSFVRSFGGYIEPVSRVNTVTAVYLAGAVQPTSDYTINADAGNESGSTIIFTTAPTEGTVITASFSYYWRCRFSDDTTDFTKFLYGLSSVSSLKFESVK